jgi:hypothetical protein
MLQEFPTKGEMILWISQLMENGTKNILIIDLRIDLTLLGILVLKR